MGHIRYREKNLPVHCSGGQFIADIHGTPVIIDLAEHDYEQVVRRMTDVVGDKGNDFNPCFHEKLIFRRKPIENVRFEHNPVTHDEVSYTFTGGQGISFENLILACRDLTPAHSVEELDDWVANAIHHFKTAVDDTASIANFLIELIQMCEGNVVKLKRFIDKINAALKAFWKLYNETGNYWLAWNFAIKPTIRDVRAMLDSLSAARKRLKWLKKRNNLDTKVKYRTIGFQGADVVEYDDRTFWPMTVGVDYVKPTGTWMEISYEKFEKPSSWAWVRFSIPQHLLEGWGALGIVWSGLMGLDNPVKVGWEAVPFSWLVDWFISRKTQLQLEHASLSPLKDADIIGTGFTLKTTVFGSVRWYGPPFEVGSTTPQVYELGEFIYECYDRRPGMPDGNSSPFRIPIDWYQASIIAALFHQKRRRGRSRR